MDSNIIVFSKFEIGLIIIYMLHDMPIVGYKFPSVIYAVLVLLLFTQLIRKVSRLAGNWVFSLFLIPIANLLLNVTRELNLLSFLQNVSGLLQFMMYTLIAIILVKTRNLKQTRIILFSYMLISLVTCITTVYGCLKFPGASRYLAVGDESVVDDFSLYQMANIAGFGFVYTMVLTYPIFVYLLRTKIISTNLKLLSLIYVAAIFAVVHYTEYTTALIFFIVLSSLFLIRKDNLVTKNIIMIILVSLVTFTIIKPVISSGTMWLAENVESRNVADRLTDLSLFIDGKESASHDADLDDRNERMKKSINTFLSNPLGAWSGKGTGGHSYFFDNLAIYGLLGFLMMFFIFKNVYRHYILCYKGEDVFNFALFIFLAAIGLTIVNTGFFYEPLTFTLPLTSLLLKHSH